jgi:hypothetical protein
MVFKDSKESIESDIHARWLNHGAVERFNLYAASVDFGLDVAVT